MRWFSRFCRSPNLLRSPRTQPPTSTPFPCFSPSEREQASAPRTGWIHHRPTPPHGLALGPYGPYGTCLLLWRDSGPGPKSCLAKKGRNWNSPVANTCAAPRRPATTARWLNYNCQIAKSNSATVVPAPDGVQLFLRLRATKAAELRDVVSRGLPFSAFAAHVLSLPRRRAR